MLIMMARHVLTPLAGFADEVASTAAAVARYPLGLAGIDHTTGHASDPVHDAPVLLVHGYGHNQSGWWEFDRQLRLAGFTSVHRMNYLPIGHGVPRIARRLGKRVDQIRLLTGADRVNVVAHSLGGILLRWYVQEMGGDQTVGTAITLATPHEGTLAAYLWPERTARQIRPGSWLIERLAAGARPSPVQWVAYWSDSDLLVQPHNAARIAAADLEATNIKLTGVGHMTMLMAGSVILPVIRQLESSAATLTH
jgi:triacylglycerol lipase